MVKLIFFVGARGWHGVASLVSSLLTHGGQVLHALGARKFTVAAAPCVESFLTLGVVQQRELLTVGELFRLAGTSPVAGRLHAVVSVVFELKWTSLSAEDALAGVAFVTLREASVEAELLVLGACGVGSVTSA